MKKETIKKIVDSILPSDLTTLVVWILGAFLIKASTNIRNTPQEIRMMYLLFITLYIVLMMVILHQTEIMHRLRRIESSRR
ncbi:MAG: hypothetical protein DRP18_03060 [Candidatus Aenigmatarchaeota archaeon]|nr:MAG: hypothetical protein DRP18_03060 [Candidatus Aenigmarchaeota archaeon]